MRLERTKGEIVYAIAIDIANARDRVAELIARHTRGQLETICSVQR